MERHVYWSSFRLLAYLEFKRKRHSGTISGSSILRRFCFSCIEPNNIRWHRDPFSWQIRPRHSPHPLSIRTHFSFLSCPFQVLLLTGQQANLCSKAFHSINSSLLSKLTTKLKKKKNISQLIDLNPNYVIQKIILFKFKESWLIIYQFCNGTVSSNKDVAAECKTWIHSSILVNNNKPFIACCDVLSRFYIRHVFL